MEKKTVTITSDRYGDLLRSEAHLNALESLGVDNWGGYVGRYRYCKECDAEASWAESKCSECSAELPEAWDMY